MTTGVKAALEEVKLGRPIVIVDDSDRENEGDLMIAAEKVTVESVSFMIREGRGLVCLSLSGEIVERLGLAMQVSENRTRFGTNFTVSIDHVSVRENGDAASSRVKTILRAVDEGALPEEFLSPGSVHPLRARDGGVLRRRGQTEGSVDVARLAGLKHAAVICEVMNEEGKLLRGDGLERFCSRHALRRISIAEILEYRLQNEVALRRVAERYLEKIELPGGATAGMRVIVYADDVDEQEHLALVLGKPEDGALVRVHSECLTGDVFESRRCDCGYQLHHSLEVIAGEGAGVVVYLHQEGRGIGLANKLLAYELQERGRDTVEANVELGFPVDDRNYRAAAHILHDLGLKRIRLVTNNPDKLRALPSFGIEVQERVPSTASVDRWNEAYLKAKRDRLGHLLALSPNPPRKT